MAWPKPKGTFWSLWTPICSTRPNASQRCWNRWKIIVQILRWARVMSGVFALRRETYLSAKRLTPIGYKIGLELMCKCQVKSVREVPIHFGARRRGESKLTVKEQYRYLAHLSRLYDYHFPRASPISKFLVVLACSWIWAGPLYVILNFAGFRTFQSAVAAYP